MLISTRNPVPSRGRRGAGLPGPPPWRALPVLMAGTFMIVLDFFVVNVALPSMQSQLHASIDALWSGWWPATG